MNGLFLPDRDYHVLRPGQRLTAVKVVRKSLCPCGETYLNDDVSDDQEYMVNLAAKRYAILSQCGKCGTSTPVHTIPCWDQDRMSIMVAELFGLEPKT